MQTRKSKLDIHFSFLNTKFKSFVEDENDIVIEDNIAKAIAFAGSVQGTTSKLIDVFVIGSHKCLNRPFTKAKNKIRFVHEIIWEHDRVHLIKISNITPKETFHKSLLESYTNYDLEVQVDEEYISHKGGIWMKEKQFKSK